MRTPFIAGNWKMHKLLAEARELVSGIIDAVEDKASVEVLICPPVQLLFPMAKALAGTPIMMGAQNAHEASSGAFTGEVSALMLKDTGCTHVIIGHSERRHLFGEDGPLLAKKVEAVLDAGLIPIYCVGETLVEREEQRTHSVVERQLADVVKKGMAQRDFLIAYEPVWAIGTGKTATPQQAQDVHAFIRKWLVSTLGPDVGNGIRILYGGSVKPGNASDLLANPDVDGALVGGACLEASDFAAIIAAAVSVASPA